MNQFMHISRSCISCCKTSKRLVFGYTLVEETQKSTQGRHLDLAWQRLNLSPSKADQGVPNTLGKKGNSVTWAAYIRLLGGPQSLCMRMRKVAGCHQRTSREIAGNTYQYKYGICEAGWEITCTQRMSISLDLNMVHRACHRNSHDSSSQVLKIIA